MLDVRQVIEEVLELKISQVPGDNRNSQPRGKECLTSDNQDYFQHLRCRLERLPLIASKTPTCR
jgi:hypothetical protein